MLIEILKIIGGLIALIFGGDLLLRSAVAASNKFKISKIVIGMTVVSFATSLPELIVSVRSATLGYPDLALGNIVGSNIANLGFVLAIILLFTRIKISKSFYKSDWPMMFISSILLWAFIQDGNISFYEGIIFLVILIIYTAFLILVRDASFIFSFKPPIGNTRPLIVISPVISTSFLILLLVKDETSELNIAIPALGPSFGVAPSGT